MQFPSSAGGNFTDWSSLRNFIASFWVRLILGGGFCVLSISIVQLLIMSKTGTFVRTIAKLTPPERNFYSDSCMLVNVNVSFLSCFLLMDFMDTFSVGNLRSDMVLNVINLKHFASLN